MQPSLCFRDFPRTWKMRGELTPIPANTLTVNGKDLETLLKLLEMLEDLDDVQKVVGNFEVDDEELERLSA